MSGATLLALNSGSSSLKFALYHGRDTGIEQFCSGEAESIGAQDSKLWIRDTAGHLLTERKQPIPGTPRATSIMADELRQLGLPAPDAIGHRIVHGGPHVRDHTAITPEVLRHLQEAATFAPLHIPTALIMIEETRKLFPGVPQFACLDTAFHRHLPEAAARFALPVRLWNAGIRRYGFHGLSCESILYTLGTDVPPRMIIAHLGSGASLTAIANGVSVDTTMGLTPTGGIVMGTRAGDLDPGVLLHLLRSNHTSPDQLEKLVDKESGLLGISGLSNDLRQLHAASNNPEAKLAIEIFCRSAKKAIGAFVAILGGLDLLVFTAGIGEHDAEARGEICDGLEPMSIVLDPQANRQNLRVISSSASRARVSVIPTDEDAQIARHTYRLLNARKKS